MSKSNPNIDKDYYKTLFKKSILYIKKEFI